MAYLKTNRGGKRATANSSSGSGGGSGAIGATRFSILTDQEAQDIREDEDDRYSPSVLDAIKQYISKATDANGYSMSQNLNYKLNNDLPLNANERYMLKYLQQGMHDLGKDTILYRGAHEDMLQALGVNNYQNYSEAQLKQMLVGASFKSKGFTSASYDKSKNPFYTGANAGGREVEVVIKAPASSKIVFGAKSQAEVILNTNTQFKVTDIKYTGRTATPRNAGVKKVVQVEVEVV